MNAVTNKLVNKNYVPPIIIWYCETRR